MDLLALPAEVLAVAAQLPPGLRHRNFSLVSTNFKAAADHATITQPEFGFAAPVQAFKRRSDEYDYYGYFIDHQPPEDEIEELGLADHRRLKRCKTFAGWLLKYGRHLTKLQLTHFNTPLGSLPPGLRELELHGCSARWHAGGSWHSEHTLSLHGLTALTRLHSCCCTYTPATLTQIAAATSLQHLDFNAIGPRCPSNLCEPTWARTACTDCHLGTGCVALPSDMFRQLSNLTHLELHCVRQMEFRQLLDIDGTEGAGHNDEDGALLPAPNASQHLSCLVKLQTLIIRTGAMSAQLEAGLEGLRCRECLSRLEVSFKTSGITQPDGSVRRSRSSWLQGLSALQVLSLNRTYINPDLLHDSTQLEVLRLNEVVLSPTRLLGLLPHLTRLQCLDVTTEWWAGEPPPLEAGEGGGAAGAAADWECPWWPPASPAYASLTASSQLQQLALINCVLPAGAWQHAFPPGRQLTALQLLRVCSFGLGAGLSRADLVSIAFACPNMQNFCVW